MPAALRCAQRYKADLSGAELNGAVRANDAGRCESMRIDASQAKPSGLPGMKVAPSCGRGLAGWWAEGLVAII